MTVAVTVVADYGITVIFFAVGIIMTAIAGLWFVGPIGRTFLAGKLIRRAVAILPRTDRLFDAKLTRKGVKGKVIIKEYGIYKLDPTKTYITSDGVRVAEFPDGMAVNSTPEDAALAERHAKGEKNPKVGVMGKNYSYNDLITSLRETLGPDQLVDIMFRTTGAWSPVKLFKGKINFKALIIIGIVAAVIFVALFVARSQGWI